MKSVSMYAAMVALCIAGLVFAAGCKTTAKPAMAKDGSVCPMCKTATQSVAVKDLTCNKIACPRCGKVTTMDGPLASTLKNYVGYDLPATVRMCPRCKCAVAPCADCRKAKPM